MNHRKVVFIYTSLVSRAPVQQEAETTAVYTKVHAHDRIVCEGVNVSVHGGKNTLHVPPKCIGIMTGRVWPSLSLMLRCWHHSVKRWHQSVKIMTLTPWQTTQSGKLDTIYELDKRVMLCTMKVLYMDSLCYDVTPHCYSPKCICAVVWCKSTLSRNTGGVVNEHWRWCVISGNLNWTSLFSWSVSIACGLCQDQYNMTALYMRCDHLCTWEYTAYSLRCIGIMSSIV